MANQLTASFKILDKNVGIGTTLPAQKLHVVNSSTGEIARFQTTGGDTGGSWIGFHNSALDLGYFGWGSSSNNHLYIINYQNAPIRFYTNGDEKMRIDASGNVGINATTLSNKLTVDGNTLLDGNLTVTGQSLLLSASYVNITSSVVSIGDNILTLNAYSPFKRYAGFEMHDSGSSALAQFLWDSENNYFFVSGSTETNSQHQILLGPDGKADLTAGALPVSYTGNELSSSIVYQSNNAIGIGTSSPSNILHIKNADPTIRLEDSSPDGVYGLIDAAGGDFIISADGGAGSADSFISFRVDGTAVGSEKMRITSGGNVGIGTTTPGTLFHVYQSSASSLETLFENSGSGQVGLTLRTDRSSNGNLIGFINFDANDNGNNNTRYNTIESYIVDSSNGTEDGRLTFSTFVAGTDVEVMHIMGYADEGRVGIGTIAPSQKLEVTGNIRVIPSSGDAFIRLTDIGIRNWDLRVSDGSDYFEIDGTTATSLAIKGNGNVGIGTTNPTEKLHVYVGNASAPTDSNTHVVIEDSDHSYLGIYGGTGSDVGIHLGDTAIDARIAYHNSSRKLAFYAGGAGDQMTIDSSGNVGIGTTSPTAQLEISSSSASSLLHVKGAGGNNILYVSGSGNIGIGTTSPTSRLYVNGGSKYLGGGDWTTIERVTSTEVNYALYVQTTGSNTNQAIAKFTYGATEGTANSGTAVAAIARQTSTFISQLHIYGSTSVAGSVYGAFLGTYSGGTSISPGELVLATQGKTGWGPGDELGRIRFYLGDPSGVGTRDVAKIVAVNEDGDGSTTTTASGALAFYTSAYNSTSLLERLRIDQSGKVGINTNNPTARLQINDDYTTTSYGGGDLYVKGSSSRSSYDPDVQNTTDLQALITVSSNNTTGPDKPGLILHNDDNTAGGFSPMLLFSKRETGSTDFKATMAGIYARSPLGTGNAASWIDGELIFATAGAASQGIKQRMVINKEGLVGIGTTSPDSLLHIFTGDPDFGVGGIIQHDTSAAGRFATLSFGAGSYRKAAIAIESSGDTNGTGDLVFAVDSNNDAANVASGDEKMRIQSDGNVGIGTTSPNVKLEIHGSDITTSADTTAEPVLRLVRDIVDPNATLRKDSAVDFMLSRQQAVANNLPYTRLDIRLAGITDSSTPSVDVMSLLYNGNVGIGTTSPQYKLDVAGTINSSNAIYAADVVVNGVTPTITLNDTDGDVNAATAYVQFQQGGTGIGKVGDIASGRSAMMLYADSGKELMLFTNGQNATSDTPAITINTSQIVGIGTTSPSAQLEISSSSASSLLNVKGAGGNGLLYVSGSGHVGMGTTSPSSRLNVISDISSESVFKAEGTSGTLFEVTDDLSNSLMSVNTIAGLPVFEVFSDYHIVGGRYNQNDFYLSAGGSLGLGTSSPITKLNIKGDQSANGQLYIEPTNDSEYAGLVIKTTRGADRAYAIFAGGTGTDDLNFRFRDASAGVDRMVIDSGGNVGIGTTTPDLQLHVKSSSGNSNLLLQRESFTPWQVSAGSTYLTFLQYGGSELVRIQNTGNVGIGTTSPGAKLDVQGSTNSPLILTRTSSGIVSAIQDSAGYGEFGLYQAGGGVKAYIAANADSYLLGGGLGIGTTSPTEKLEVSGSILSNSFGVSGSAVTPSFIGVPQGGSYNSNSTETGYLKINLPIEPISTTDVTVSFKVKVSEGSINKFSIYNVTGTLFGSSIWQAASAYFETSWKTTTSATSGSFIDLGRDGTSTTGKSSVLINSGRNELSSWTSPIVQVYDVSIGGVNNYNVSDWLEGWNVSFTTSKLGYTNITYPMGRVSGTNPTPLKYNQSKSGTVTLAIQGNWGGFQRISLASGTTIQSISYTNIPAGYSVTIAVLLLYGGTATVTWTNVKWSGGVTPTLTGVNGKADLFTITSYDGGSNWIGSVVAQNLDSTNL